MLLSKFRTLTQICSSVLCNSYIGTFYTKSVNTSPLKGLCVPVLNCYACPSALFSCPIGTLQHFMAIHTFPVYLAAFIGLIGLTVGRMACGWVCPFGFFQDLMYKIRSPKYSPPPLLRYLKYVVLILLVIILPYATGELWFSMLCPAGKLTAGIPWALWNPTNPSTDLPVLPQGPGVLFYVGLLILAGFLVWFVVSKRPFCKVACPMGAIFGLFNRFSLIRIEASRECDGCNTCHDRCPMGLNIYTDADSPECIRCLECTRCGHVRLVMPSIPGKEVRWSEQQKMR